MEEKKIRSVVKIIVPAAMGLILFVFFVWRFDIVANFLRELFTILRPIIIGLGIAFVLNAYVTKVQKFWNKDKVPEKVSYTLSIIIIYIIFLSLLTLLVCFIVPQLSESVMFFFESFETYYRNFVGLVDKFTDKFNLVAFDEEAALEQLYAKLSEMGEYVPSILTKTFDVTSNIVKGITDVFIGFIFSIYILIGKKDFKRQARNFGKAFLSADAYGNVSALYSLTSKTFSSFISGQLTEAVILGTLCFIGMCIFKFEYAVLISVIIGVTNLIPIFGPILGTIPCAFILLLVNPQHAIWFVVYIIILQQIESQLIYPQVVGTSVGLKPFWTLFAILVGGGLFGVVGMLFAVPTMSIIYTLAGGYISLRLKDKGIKEECAEEPPKKKQKRNRK